MMDTTKMCDCPRFNRCSAPICPLDPDWRLRVYRKGEPICLYLLEYVKPDAQAQFQGSIGVPIYKAIERSIEDMSHRYAPLCRALDRAKWTGSRMRAAVEVCFSLLERESALVASRETRKGALKGR
jgi:hypothetical protein